MPATLAALLLALILADFVFQTNWMVTHKQPPKALAAHGAVVLVRAIMATGGISRGPVWALLVAYATISGLGLLPPLGISPDTP